MKKVWGFIVLGLIISFPTATNSVSMAQIDRLNSSLQVADRTLTQTEDERIFQQIMRSASKDHLSQSSMAKIMQSVAQKFIGASYQAGLLDRSIQETLVISLQKFDCLLLVENVLAIARNIALQDNYYQTFTNNLVDERYRNGKINGYCSRLHYFSEWLDENQNRGNIENITASLGGVKFHKNLNFMSNHRSSYAQLKNNDLDYKCILAMEANLRQLTLYYIPQQQIKNIDDRLQPGDIIGVATNIPGLDVTHTGLVYRDQENHVGFLHASPAGKITIASDLSKYVSQVDNAIGIMVARPIKPSSI